MEVYILQPRFGIIGKRSIGARGLTEVVLITTALDEVQHIAAGIERLIACAQAEGPSQWGSMALPLGQFWLYNPPDGALELWDMAVFGPRLLRGKRTLPAAAAEAIRPCALEMLAALPSTKGEKG